MLIPQAGQLLRSAPYFPVADARALHGAAGERSGHRLRTDRPGSVPNGGVRGARSRRSRAGVRAGAVKKRTLALGIGLLMSAALASIAAPPDPVATRFVGTWRLVSTTQRL